MQVFFIITIESTLTLRLCFNNRYAKFVRLSFLGHCRRELPCGGLGSRIGPNVRRPMGRQCFRRYMAPIRRMLFTIFAYKGHFEMAEVDEHG